MSGRVVVCAVLGLGWLASACVSSDSVNCANGRVCAFGTVCSPDNTRCVMPEQLQACSGLGELEACSYDGVDAGLCSGGVCVGAGCGNGLVEDGETCDDGNQESGDGCRADCTMCGDGIRNGAEVCDGTAFGGLACQSYGWYDGTLGCADDCESLVFATCEGYCGDGALDGIELCDGLAARQYNCTELGAVSGSIGCNAYCQGTDDVCAWSTFVETPGAATSRAIWGTGRDNLWSVGTAGEIRHWDGVAWTTVVASGTLTSNTLFAISGTAVNDIWAVGALGTIVHFDGTAWTVAPGSGTVTTTDLVGVFARTSDDVWAVGNDTIIHFDTAWALSPLDASIQTANFNAVWARSASTAWAVGSSGVIAEFDGDEWVEDPQSGVITTENLNAVWGDSDVYAAGDQRTILYRPSSTWTVVTSNTDNDDYNTVFGRSDEDVWVGGDNGLVERFDGQDWTMVATGTVEDADSIWRSPEGDVWINGGLRYTPPWQASDDVAGTPSSLDFHAVSTTYAVGSSGRLYRFSGPAWSPMTGSSTTGAAFNAVWTTTNSAWAVGGSGTIFRLTGTSWAADPGFVQFVPPEPLVGTLYGVWGTSATDVWAVGAAGDILHTNGTTWARDPAARVVATADLRGLWGTGPNDIWSVGDAGTILHYDGTWTADAASGVLTTQRLTAVWGTGPGDVWVVGNDSTILHFDGTAWRKALPAEMPAGLPSGTNLHGIHGTRTGDMWIVGEEAILHHDGLRWSASTAPPLVTFNSVYASAAHRAFAVGDNLVVYELDTAQPTVFGGSCQAPIPLYCGTSAAPTAVAGTVTPESPAQLASYACGTRSADGSEVYYRLDVPITGDVVVELAPFGGDLDLIAIGAGANGGCDAGQCRAASQTAGAGVETVTVAATRGETLYFVVDSPAAATTSYSLRARCVK